MVLMPNLLAHHRAVAGSAGSPTRSQPTPPAVACRPESLRVVVAGDTAALHELRDGLASLGHQASSAASVAALVEQCRQRPPDLLVAAPGLHGPYAVNA